MLVFERKVPLKPIVEIFQTILSFSQFANRAMRHVWLHNESKQYQGDVHQ